MRQMGQEATELPSATARPLGQGATEYLVLLAVVLIIALVAIALLGFFPGTASDTQIAESQIYWRSASPIMISEWGARQYASAEGYTRVYLRMRNNGQYPLRITAFLDKDATAVRQVWSGGSCGFAASINISDLLYLGPGEEGYVGYGAGFGLPCNRDLYAITGSSSSTGMGKAISVCQNSSSAPGNLVLNSFGFEYIQYVEGQQITKREIGKALIIKCREPL